MSWRSDTSAAAPPRPVLPGDAQALAQFFAANRGVPENAGFDPFELTAERARAIAAGASSDRYYLATNGRGELVAMSMLRGFDEGYAVPSFGILVDHGHHGLGIGRKLTAWTIAAARELACPAVRLSVYASNPGALALYRSLGFVEQDRSAVRRAGRTDAKITMRLELGAGDG